MARLGYSRYGVQGGDWGGIIGRRIAQRHSGAVAALHTNIPYAYPPKGAEAPESYKEFRKTGTAYLVLQETKPASIAPALSASQMGLANWSHQMLARGGWVGAGTLRTIYKRKDI